MLFDNVGKNMCNISKILFYIFGIGGVIGGIILAIEYSSIIIFILGIVLSISTLCITLLLYGFGQLLLNVQEINTEIKKK